MIRFPLYLGGAFFVVVIVGRGFADPAPSDGTPPIDVSAETTFVVEPLRPDGFVDFAAAIERHYSEGVTTENNAAVLLLEAIGPTPAGTELPDEVFAKLGMPPPPFDGKYFIPLGDHLKNAGKPLSVPEQQKLLRDARWDGWSREEMPDVASWLDANAEAMKKLATAADRPKYFMPLLLPTENHRWSQGLGTAQLPLTQAMRELVQAFLSRAMRHFGEGEAAPAWDDMLVANKLARLVTHGPFLMDAMGGLAFEHQSQDCLIASLEYGVIDAASARQALESLANLGPVPHMGAKVDLVERLCYLDSLLLAMEGGDGAEKVLGMLPNIGPTVVRVVKAIHDPRFPDYDASAAARAFNPWFDQLVAAMNKPSYRERREALEDFQQRLDAAAKENGQKLKTLLTDPRRTPTRVGALVGEGFMVMFLPKLDIQPLADQVEQRRQILNIAFALAAFQQERGAYPSALAELVPDYLANIAEDWYGDGPPRYDRLAVGYRLYSVGPNGRDDRGQRPKKDTDTDDISIQVPGE